MYNELLTMTKYSFQVCKTDLTFKNHQLCNTLMSRLKNKSYVNISIDASNNKKKTFIKKKRKVKFYFTRKQKCVVQ